MKLYNPTNNKLTIVFKGVEYSIDAKSNSNDLKPEVAIHWMDSIHQFLEPAKDNEEEVVVTDEKVESVVEKIKKTVKKATTKKK